MLCASCEHSRFCDTWAEWKCVKKCIRFSIPNIVECNDYKKIKDVKDKPTCQCKHCLERERDED